MTEYLDIPYFLRRDYMSKASIGSIMTEVRNERYRQDDKWGGSEHDDNHATLDFLGFIIDRVEAPSAREITNTQNSSYDRKDLIEIAALAVAAIESIDRKS